jgi:OOP family OmpA-OmpF porin
MVKEVVRACILIGLMTALAGCASSIQRMNSVQATGGTPFTRALTEEYRGFVATEQEEYDWSAARYFAHKGLAAAKGEMVLPEDVARVPSASADDLTSARSRLTQVLDGGARDSNPEVAARAQRAFDCWVHEAKENLGDAHVAPCRDEFSQAMGVLEAKPKVEAAPPPQPAAPAAPSTYTVLFDWNRADITAPGKAVLDQVLADAAKQATVNISATGYTDLSGSEEYNQKLSLLRADAVRDYLIKGGIPAERITVAGRGEADPAVPTAEGVREQANRRVEIILQ